MRQLCFRVDKFPFISRFRVGFVFYLSTLQICSLTVSKKCSHSLTTCVRRVPNVIERGLKERFPKGTRNKKIETSVPFRGFSTFDTGSVISTRDAYATSRRNIKHKYNNLSLSKARMDTHASASFKAFRRLEPVIELRKKIRYRES
jgi:hypothetical protein